MHHYDTTEQAYRNGYAAGKRDAVKHGRWEYVGESNGVKVYRCTNCGSLVAGQGNFCKVCGAMMDLPNITKETAQALEAMGKNVHQEGNT